MLLNKAGTFSGYKLQGRIKFQGLDISIENARGSFRRGESPDGKEWATFMHMPYGYIRKTEGVDGDHVDCYIGPAHYSEKVFIIHQQDPKTKEYDEDKVMLGYNSGRKAKTAYCRQYDSYGFFQSMEEVTMKEFKKMLKNCYGVKLKKSKSAPVKLTLMKGKRASIGDISPDGRQIKLASGKWGANPDYKKGTVKQKVVVNKRKRVSKPKAVNYTVFATADDLFKFTNDAQPGDRVLYNTKDNDGQKVKVELIDRGLHANWKDIKYDIVVRDTQNKRIGKTIHLRGMAQTIRFLTTNKIIKDTLQKAKGKKMMTGETVSRKDGTYIKLSGGKFKKLSEKDMPKSQKGKGTGTRIKTANGMRPKHVKEVKSVSEQIAEKTFDANKGSTQPYDNKKLMTSIVKYEKVYGEEARGVMLQSYARRLNKLNAKLYQEGESFRTARKKDKAVKKPTPLKKSIVLNPLNAKRLIDEL